MNLPIAGTSSYPRRSRQPLPCKSHRHSVASTPSRHTLQVHFKQSAYADRRLTESIRREFAAIVDNRCVVRGGTIDRAATCLPRSEASGPCAAPVMGSKRGLGCCHGALARRPAFQVPCVRGAVVDHRPASRWGRGTHIPLRCMTLQLRSRVWTCLAGRALLIGLYSWLHTSQRSIMDCWAGRLTCAGP